MSAVGLLLLGLAAGAAVVGWRLMRYPGGWTYAFTDAYRADRRELDDARSSVKSLESTARRERAEAKARIDEADRAYRNRIDMAERKLERLRNPGRGAFIASLGGVSLHQHVAVVKGRDVALAGLRVEFESGTGRTYIRLTEPDGHVHLEAYPEEEHHDDDVRRFGVRLQNTVVAENTFREGRGEAMKEADADLMEARAATAPKEEARQHWEAVQGRLRDDTRLADARATLTTVCDRWESMTGKRPR